jgi:1-acyl-sn-glycerol-3-phosphate acyltransferase
MSQLPVTRRVSSDVIDRHNRRIGTVVQRWLGNVYCVYLLGPIMYLLIRLAFRIRVENRRGFTGVGPRLILAFQHYYEWDPLVVYFGAAWVHSLARPSLHPNTISGPFWVSNVLVRSFAYLMGSIAVARGAGRGQSGLAQAAKLLTSRFPATVAIAPTGPVGARRDVEIKPGVAYVALDAPEVPVVPVAVTGLAGVKLDLGIFFRRPKVTIAIGEALRAADVAGSEDERVASLCNHIRAEWERLEGRAPALKAA